MIEASAMFGDADGYDSVELGPFQNNEEHLKYLEEAIIACDDMEKAYPHGRCGYDNYHSDNEKDEGYVAGFDLWFNNDNFDDDYDYDEEDYDEENEDEDDCEDNKDPRLKLGCSWPSCPDGYGSQASFDEYKVFYYDKDGIKYEVEIIK
jgi:hypothetical protein